MYIDDTNIVITDELNENVNKTYVLADSFSRTVFEACGGDSKGVIAEIQNVLGDRGACEGDYF